MPLRLVAAQLIATAVEAVADVAFTHRNDNNSIAATVRGKSLHRSGLHTNICRYERYCENQSTVQRGTNYHLIWIWIDVARAASSPAASVRVHTTKVVSLYRSVPCFRHER